MLTVVVGFICLLVGLFLGYRYGKTAVTAVESEASKVRTASKALCMALVALVALFALPNAAFAQRECVKQTLTAVATFQGTDGIIHETVCAGGTGQVYVPKQLLNLPLDTVGSGVVSTATITPVATAAAIATVTQTFTLTGVVSGDLLDMVKVPAPTSLCPLISARATAANVVSLDFLVLTAAACTPASGVYSFLVVR